jgi:hypothetical protein
VIAGAPPVAENPPAPVLTLVFVVAIEPSVPPVLVAPPIDSVPPVWVALAMADVPPLD